MTNAANFNGSPHGQTSDSNLAGAPGHALLIGHAAADAVFACREGIEITAADFLHDVLVTKDQLPDARWVINLASDRYSFAVGLAAALMRGQVTLLPPNHASATIADLIDRYSPLYALTDGLRPHDSLSYVEIKRAPHNAQRAKFSVPTIPYDAPALVLFTSGSTGTPIATQKRWGPFLESVRAEAEGLSLNNRGLSIVGTVPPQHSYGLESTILLPMLCGHIMEASKPFYPADICSTLAALPRPRMLVTTPVHLSALMRSRLLCPQVDLLLSATAPLPIELAREAEERFRAPLMEIYGCSEAGQLATRRTTDSPAWALMRNIALTQDPDGRSWVRGGHVPGEVPLADIIEPLDQHHFLLRGRDADLVNIAGKRTSLAFLNQQLAAIAGVEDCAFLIPDERDDEVTRLTAFVVAPSLTEQAIVKALRERIDPVFLPRPLLRVSSLPRNAAGKLPREDLVTLARHLAAQRAR